MSTLVEFAMTMVFLWGLVFFYIGFHVNDWTIGICGFILYVGDIVYYALYYAEKAGSNLQLLTGIL